MPGEGHLAVSQGPRKDLPSPWGQECGLQASGFSSGAALGVASCESGVGCNGTGPSVDQQSPGTGCPQLGCLIVRHPCHSQGCLNAPPIQLNNVLHVLSSFGHAKTVLNANASRFGQVLCLGLQQ